MRFVHLTLTLLVLTTIAGADPVRLYVSTSGDDTHSGRAPATIGSNGPYRTVSRAVEEVDYLLAEQLANEHGVEVLIEPGQYRLYEPIRFRRNLSNDPTVPILFKGDGDSEVVISGGTPISGIRSAEELPEDIKYEVSPELSWARLPDTLASDLGSFRGGYASPREYPAWLYIGEEPMELASWPSEGFAQVDRIRSTNSGRVRITLSEPPLYRWRNEPAVWIHAYWFYDWADQRTPVARVFPILNRIDLAGANHRYGYRPGARYYFFNLISEVNSPGKWAVDPDRGIVYFLPDEDSAASHVPILSLLDTLVRLEGVADVRFENVVFEHSRGDAVSVKNSNRIAFRDCTFRNIGGWALKIEGGHGALVVDSEFHDLGEGGVSISGGARVTLEPGDHSVRSSHFYRYSRFIRTYRPAISISGVGNSATGNLIHDAPHQAIAFSGNDHLIAENFISNVVTETSDAGAIYAGRDWTMRGTRIIGNTISDVQGLGRGQAVGVYLDDGFSGVEIENNNLLDVSLGVLIGGGRDNLVRRNRFVENDIPVHLDSRGTDWAAKSFAPGGSARMFERLRSVNFDQPPYSTKYPELASMLEEAPREARGNQINQNKVFGCTRLRLVGIDLSTNEIGPNSFTPTSQCVENR